ncbi:MAG: TonB-dependent receptor [Mangrovibacterium sp.]
MRLTLFFFLVGISQIFATDLYSQQTKLSLSVSNTRLANVLDEIEKQSEFYFLFNQKDIDLDRLVNVSLTDKKISEVLDVVFSGTEVRYIISDRQIVLISEDRKADFSAGQQKRTVSGKVTDQEGQALPGVTVVVKNTSFGAITDSEGRYELEVPAGENQLVFSFIGMKTTEEFIGPRTEINVSLESDIIGLEEVVAVGYGTQRKGDITGSIVSVSADDIQELPVIDAGAALQGRASGVMAMSTGQRPGENVTIRIRGRRSLTASNEPLYVVDGIPYEGNINDINPRDIKSMEILKDASATAIYGSRGANGVILITTFRGGNMPTTVSYNGYYGITSSLGEPDMMNGEEFIRLKEVAGRDFTTEELDAIERGVSTDWVDLIIDHGYKQSHQLGVRGGNSKTAFALSANLYDEEGIIKVQDFTRKTLRINLDHHVSDRIRVGTSTQLSDQEQNYGLSDEDNNPYAKAVSVTPLSEPYDSEGNMIYQLGGDTFGWNPLADLVDGAYVDERTRLRVFSNLYVEVDILENLNYRMNYGLDYQKYRRGLFEGSLSSARQYSSPRAMKEHEETTINTFENIFTYSKEFSQNHKLKATGLFSIQESDYEMTMIDVEDLPYEHQSFHNLSTAETVLDYDSDKQEWGIMSFMGRINYDLMDKYLFTFTGRYDGSSRLSEDKRWGFFPSAAFLWKISNENFMSAQNLFSNLNLRLSYGVTGNTAVDPYQTKGSLTRTTYSFGGNSGYGYKPGSLANEDLEWESSATTNIGIDFGIGQSIAGTFEVYRTKTTDLLLERNLPITSGFESVMENIGETKNKGWELTLNARLVNKRNFTWTTDLNLFGNKEEIVDLYGTKEDDSGNEWFIGEPLSVWYDYKKIGIWQTDEAEQAAVYQQNPGEIKIEDVNQDDIINEKDKVILGSNIPDFTLGLGSRFTYKNFEFSFLLLGIFGQTVYNDFEVDNSTLQGRYNNLNVDYWTETNPTNDNPKPDGDREYPLYSESRAYQSGDFLKVKNIQLGYNLPKKFLSKFGIKSMKVYVNADTPFVFSELDSNLDPETFDGVIESNGSPSTRMYSLGINVDF